MKSRVERIAEFRDQYRDFQILESIHMKRQLSQHESTRYDIDMILRRVSLRDNHKLHITFRKATDIKIGNLEGILVLLVNIVDVSQHQWEDVHYKVTEEEYDTFSFYCKDFQYSLIT